MAFTPGTDNTLEVAVQSTGVGSFVNSMNAAIHAIGGVRGAALVAGGALAVALAAKGFSVAIDAASDFEDAMVEVQKVTDEATAAKVADEVRELARTIPLTQEKLAGIAADAARFGVKGPEDIRNFTETVAKMASATDLSADEAGQAFAKIANLTGTPVSKIENLGSSINTLSNNFATSSSEIVDGMLRSSAALTQFGLSNTEIAGLQASLNEVSESSERAGTRLRRVAQELMDPDAAEDIANALGMTPEAFREMREEAPLQLIMKMVEAFREGGSTADALRGQLSTTSRQALAGLAQNAEGLNRALDLSAESFEENTSLQREFDAATDTFNSRLKLLKNRLHDVAITVGNVLLPPTTRLLEGINDLFDTVGRADGAVAGLGSSFAGLGAVWNEHAGPLLGEGGEMQAVMADLRDFWNEWGDEILTVWGFVWDTVGGVLAFALDAILTIVRIVLNVLQGDWEEAWLLMGDFVIDTLNGILAWIHKWGTKLEDAILGAVPEGMRETVAERLGIGSAGRGAPIQIPNPFAADLARVQAEESRAAAVAETRESAFTNTEQTIRVTGELREKDGEVVALIDDRVQSGVDNEASQDERLAGRPSGV